MNSEEMIECVLIKAEGAERDRLEAALRDDPEQAARLDRLRHSVHHLLDDGAWFDHPPDLAARTVSLSPATDGGR